MVIEIDLSTPWHERIQVRDSERLLDVVASGPRVHLAREQFQATSLRLCRLQITADDCGQAAAAGVSPNGYGVALAFGWQLIAPGVAALSDVIRNVTNVSILDGNKPVSDHLALVLLTEKIHLLGWQEPVLAHLCSS